MGVVDHLLLSEASVWRRIAEGMADDPDFEYLILDSAVTRAHHHAVGAKRDFELFRADLRAALCQAPTAAGAASPLTTRC